MIGRLAHDAYRHRFFIEGLLVALSVVLLDGFTKTLAIANEWRHDIHYVDPSLVSAVTAALAAVTLLVLFSRNRNGLGAVSVGLWLGGCLANNLFWFGAVPNWIYLGGRIFNLADAGIALGALCTAIVLLRGLRRARGQQAAPVPRPQTDPRFDYENAHDWRDVR